MFSPAKKPCPFASHHLYHGDIVYPGSGIVLDEVLITLMKAPHSFTGEDTIEINCHGGPAILRAVLAEVIKAGARPAEPGEFTRRAFLNDRLDLSQAEAVADLMSAQTDEAREQALSQLKGRLSEKVRDLRSTLIDSLAHLEAAVDFPEEDPDAADIPVDRMIEDLRAAADDILEILSTYEEGRIIREGLAVVIVGKPNTGKSSLLNQLLGQERAIVTPVPGTTRDFIEETIHLKGITVRLTDTAGVRDLENIPENIIEREGIGKVWQRIAKADAVILLLDGSGEIDEEDLKILEGIREKKVLVAVNKADLPRRLTKASLARVNEALPLPHREPLWISAKYGEGLDQLLEELHLLALGGKPHSPSEMMIGNLRHKKAFEDAAGLLLQARDSLLQGLSPELASLDLREALRTLGEIVGETTGEDVLDRIFSNFCIGK